MTPPEPHELECAADELRARAELYRGRDEPGVDPADADSFGANAAILDRVAHYLANVAQAQVAQQELRR